MFSSRRTDVISWRVLHLFFVGLVAHRQLLAYGLPVQAKVENELTGVFGPYQNEDNLTNDLSVDDLLMMLKELSKYSMPRSTWFSMSPQNPSSPQKQDLPMTDSNFEVDELSPVTGGYLQVKRNSPEGTHGRYSNYYRQHALYNTKNNWLSAMFNSNSNNRSKIFGRSQPEDSLGKRWGSENIITNRQSQYQQHELWKQKQRLLQKLFSY